MALLYNITKHLLIAICMVLFTILSKKVNFSISNYLCTDLTEWYTWFDQFNIHCVDIEADGL